MLHNAKEEGIADNRTRVIHNLYIKACAKVQDAYMAERGLDYMIDQGCSPSEKTYGKVALSHNNPLFSLLFLSLFLFSLPLSLSLAFLYTPFVPS